MGGCTIDADYAKVDDFSFQHSLQLRNSKALITSETNLIKSLKDTTAIKFNGKTDSSSTDGRELSKDELIEALKLEVGYYGLENFFYLPNADGDMVYLLDEAQNFTLKEVTDEFNSRMIEPAPQYVTDSSGTQTETVASVQARYRAYDEFEKGDIGLSRLVVESQISPTIREQVRTRFSHVANFARLPGQVYLMMVLDTCHSSASLDIDTARENFANLKLSSFPGENVGAFGVEALKLIKIMNTGYAMEVTVGLKMLRKITNTSNDYFNRKVYNLLDKARELEIKYNLKDPKLMKKDPLYSKFGPIGLCGEVTRFYSQFIKDGDWPALKADLPQGNLGGATPNPNGGRKNKNGKKCFQCGSEFHLYDKCPHRPGGGGGDTGGNNGASGNSGASNPPSTTTTTTPVGSTSATSGTGGSNPPRAKAAWKYIHPADPNQVLTDANGVVWKFCSKCVCPLTQKVGLYTRSHTTSEHREGFSRGNGDDANTSSSSGPAANVAEQDTRHVSFADAVRGGTETDEVDENEELSFVGAWCAMVVEPASEEQDEVKNTDISLHTEEIDIMQDSIGDLSMSDSLLTFDMGGPEGSADNPIEVTDTMVEGPSVVTGRYESSVGTVDNPIKIDDDVEMKDDALSVAMDSSLSTIEEVAYEEEMNIINSDFTPVLTDIDVEEEDEFSFTPPAHRYPAPGYINYNAPKPPPSDSSYCSDPTYDSELDGSISIGQPKSKYDNNTSESQSDDEEEVLDEEEDSSTGGYSSEVPVVLRHRLGNQQRPELQDPDEVEFEFKDGVLEALNGPTIPDEIDLGFEADAESESVDSEDKLEWQDSTNYTKGNIDEYLCVPTCFENDIFFDCASPHLHGVGLDHVLLCEDTPNKTAPQRDEGSFLLQLMNYWWSLWVSIVSWTRCVSDHMCLWGFFFLTLTWDTLDLYQCSLPTRTRQFRRKKIPDGVFLPNFVKGWMVLSCIMLPNSSLIGHPGYMGLAQIRFTYQKCVAISHRVQMSPQLLFQFHATRYAESFPKLGGEDDGLGGVNLRPPWPHAGPTKLRSDSVGGVHRLPGGESCLPGGESCNFDVDAEASCELGMNDDADDTTAEAFLDCHANSIPPFEPHLAYFDALDKEPDDEYFDTHWEPITLTHHFTSSELSTFGVEEFLPSCTKLHCSHTESHGRAHVSAEAYAALVQGPSSFMGLQQHTTNSFQVVFDSGASKAISGCKEDFGGTIRTLERPITIGRLAHGLKVEGIGEVSWNFVTSQHESITIITECYYVPEARARLLSPQRLFNSREGVEGSFSCLEEHAILQLNNLPLLVIDYDEKSYLPIALATAESTGSAQVNLSISDESNQNLTPAQRLLLKWHYKFGHKNLPAVQKLLRVTPFGTEKYLQASKCHLPKCAICEYAKAHRKSTNGPVQKENATTDGALKVNDLRPGSSVSVDHFESRLKGRTYTSFGRTTSEQYVGGCVFVDHMSGKVHVEHQLGFSGSETIRAKQSYEQMALHHGVLVQNYLADNGIFKANKFVEHLRNHNQKVKYCGVNAHHQNGVAERSIRTVSEMSRAMLLHASSHWKHGVDASLWPMAVDYAAFVYNNVPNDKGICPNDLFSGETVPRHKLKDIHVWGCPVFVLDPKLQQGQKLPKWSPRSRQGVFMGYSPHHSSQVPLVLNLTTGSISPQFHIVFDDEFSTVNSIGQDEDPPSFWNEIDLALSMCIESP